MEVKLCKISVIFLFKLHAPSFLLLRCVPYILVERQGLLPLETSR